MTNSEIHKMNLAEKLLAMENLWNSIICDEAEIDSPGWHEEILIKPKKKIKNGKAKFKTLAELKTEY